MSQCHWTSLLWVCKLMMSGGIECCKYYFHEGGCSGLICEDRVSQPSFVFLSSLCTYATCIKTLFHLSVLILYDIKETWMPEVQVFWEMWNTKKVKGSWLLWLNLKATPFSWLKSSPWCKSSTQGSAALSEFGNKAPTVNLCRSGFLVGYYIQFMSYPYKLLLPLRFQVLFATAAVLGSRIQWFLFLC